MSSQSEEHFDVEVVRIAEDSISSSTDSLQVTYYANLYFIFNWSAKITIHLVHGKM